MAPAATATNKTRPTSRQFSAGESSCSSFPLVCGFSGTFSRLADLGSSVRASLTAGCAMTLLPFSPQVSPYDVDQFLSGLRLGGISSLFRRKDVEPHVPFDDFRHKTV